MKKIDRKKLSLTLIIVLGLVVSLSIAYAALSTTLTISGSGKVNASDWDIEIRNISNSYVYINSSTGNATFTTPTITGTTIANYTVGLTTPGDSVTLYFEVYNGGDLNGEIDSIINSTPVCVSETGNTADANLVCNNLDVSFSYFSNDTIALGHILGENVICFNSGSDYGIDNIVKVEISLKDSMTSVPGSKVTVSNLKHEIKFVQTDKVCNPSSVGVATPMPEPV